MSTAPALGQTRVQTQAAPKKQTQGCPVSCPAHPSTILMDIPPPWLVTLVQNQSVTFTAGKSFLSHTKPSWHHLPFPALLFPLELPCCRSLLGTFSCAMLSCRTSPHPWGHSGPSTLKFPRAAASPGSCRATGAAAAHPWASAPPSEIAKGSNSSFSALLRESQPPHPWQCSGSDLEERFPAHGKGGGTRF